MIDHYEQFADLLEYPITKLDANLTAGSEEDTLTSFRSRLAMLTLSDLQELYTRTFDLNPACALEVGYHLFGENYKRGELLANLRATEAPFELGQTQQLPDYLPVLLRLLPKLGDQELRSSLISECMVPAIEKMLKSFKETDNPYRFLLETVCATLQTEAPDGSIGTGHFNERANLPVIQPLEQAARFVGSAREHFSE